MIQLEFRSLTKKSDSQCSSESDSESTQKSRTPCDSATDVENDAFSDLWCASLRFN